RTRSADAGFGVGGRGSCARRRPHRQFLGHAAESGLPQSIAGSLPWTVKLPSNAPGNTPENTPADRAHFGANSRAESEADSSRRHQACCALAPSPTPFCMRRLKHLRISRSRPHNDETEGVSGKFGGRVDLEEVGEGASIRRRAF